MSFVLQRDEHHVYRVDGRVVPGVSKIIEPLRSWEGVPADVLDRAAALGTAVHLATYYDDRGTLDEASLAPEVAGYLEGWRRFRREKKPTLIHREKFVYNPALRYAGQLDAEMILDGELTIGDLKSGVKHRVHGVQIAGYALARKEEEGWTHFPRRVAIHLSPDGHYELEPYTRSSDYPTFISMLNLTHWRAAA